MPWQVEDNSFIDDVLERGVTRTVTSTDTNTWMVLGDTRKGDAYPDYVVRLDGRKYDCSCYYHSHGETRRRRICGHVRDVIAFRRDPQASDPVEEAEVEEDQGDSTQPDPPPSAPSNIPYPVPEWLDQPRPEWLEDLKPDQRRAMAEIMAHFDSGKKVVFLDAPTGAGKTLIGEVIGREFRKRTPHSQTIYACSTKSLQDQFVADFPHAAVLKGRSNYPTADHPELFPVKNAAACNKQRGGSCKACPNYSGQWSLMEQDTSGEDQHCRQCHPTDACPYQNAKLDALVAPLAVLNTSYWLTAVNYVNTFTSPGLLVVDEADQLHDELTRFVGVEITSYQRKRMGIGLPAKVTVSDAWAPWLREEVLPKLRQEVASLKGDDDRTIKNRKALIALGKKINVILDGGLEGWVLDGYEDTRKGKNPKGYINTVTLTPTWVRERAQEVLWDHAPRALLMSASFVSCEDEARKLGLALEDWAEVRMESNFHPDHRPIVFTPAANNTYANRSEAWPDITTAIDELVDRFPNERILVHTQSYGLSNFIKTNAATTRKLYHYAESGQRQGALDTWLRSDDGVLLASSFQRGIDLAHEQCRVQVIAKVPYPSLGSKLVSARVHEKGGAGQIWFSVETIRSMVQASGRVVRGVEDWGLTFVLDEQFARLKRQSGHLFPRWWKDGLVMNVKSLPDKRHIKRFEEVSGLKVLEQNER